MEKRRAFLKYFILILAISNLIIIINTFKMNKQSKGYYTGKIESINQKDSINTVEVSPISSKRYFISKIKANHKIKYNLDSISVSGIGDANKKHKSLKMGELSELITKFKVGDTIIFKIANKDYDKNEYNLEIDGLAVDLTLD